jgi:hypothetical protein
MDNRNETAYESPDERHMSNECELRPLTDVMCYLRQYTCERPEVVALTCFGVGFIRRGRLWRCCESRHQNSCRGNQD